LAGDKQAPQSATMGGLRMLCKGLPDPEVTELEAKNVEVTDLEATNAEVTDLEPGQRTQRSLTTAQTTGPATRTLRRSALARRRVTGLLTATALAKTQTKALMRARMKHGVPTCRTWQI
jgi:hypothetical protein